MKKSTCIIIMVGLLLSGCATAVKLSPQGLNSKHVIYNEGNQLFVSQKQNVIALGIVSYKYIVAGDRADFIVILDNNEDRAFDFSTENISAYCKEKRLKVYTYEELVAEIEAQRRGAKIAAILGAVSGTFQATTAGQQYHYGTYTSGYGQHGTYSGYSYNPAAAMQAQATVNQQTSQNMAMIEQNYKSSMHEIGNTILKRTTVLPKTRFGGVIKIEIPKEFKDEYVFIEVRANDERHTFQFSISKLK